MSPGGWRVKDSSPSLPTVSTPLLLPATLATDFPTILSPVVVLCNGSLSPPPPPAVVGDLAVRGDVMGVVALEVGVEPVDARRVLDNCFRSSAISAEDVVGCDEWVERVG